MDGEREDSERNTIPTYDSDEERENEMHWARERINGDLCRRMASETHIHHLKTALDEQTYFSLSDLRALTTERFSRKQPSDTYLSVDEMQEMRRSAVKADYMSIDPTRKMLGTEKEPDYLSIHQSFGSGRNPVSPDYLTVDEANRCAGQNEANYLSLEESRALLQRGGQSDGDYLSIATGDWCPVYPRSDNPLESDYLSLDQVVAMKEIFDDAYLSVEEMNMLAKEAKCKLNTQDTTYLSIEEMQHLAGGQAPFKALVSSVLKSQSSKTASKGDQQLLGDIRDKLLVDAINHGRHVLEGDAIFAHQLQKQEIAVAQKCERAINEAQLLSLERIYRKTVPGAVEPPPILKNSFTNLIKAWQKPQFVRKSVPQAPDFDKFDRQSEFASTTASKLIGILSKSGQLDVETIEDAFQIAAAVVKRVENGLDALGEANEMEVCDGIYPCMLRMLLHSVWQSARKLLAKDDKKNYQNTLRARTYRLQFLLDRMTGKNVTESVVVDRDRIRQTVEMQSKGPPHRIADVIYSWPCAFCNFVNRPSFLSCEMCKATKKTGAQLPQTQLMSDHEAGELYE